MQECPADPALLLLAALAAIVADQPARAVGFLKRHERKYEADNAVTLLTGLALARQGHTARAHALLEREGLFDPQTALRCFIGRRAMVPWLIQQLTALRTLHRPPTARSGSNSQATGRAGARKPPDAKFRADGKWAVDGKPAPKAAAASLHAGPKTPAAEDAAAHP